MKSKRIIAGVLAATVCFTAIPAGVSAIGTDKVAAVTVQEDSNAVEEEKNDVITDTEEYNVVRSGNISETITYEVYDNGLMVITGYGSLYGSDIDKTGVTSVIVEDKDADNNKVIRTIESNAFLGYTELESLVLPDHVSLIGENVFGECINLREISMSCPEGYILRNGNLWYNHEGNFEDIRPVMSDILGCIDVKKVTITTGKTIPNKMFEGMTLLEEVILPEGLEDIESSAFKNCKNLKKINLPQSLENIRERAFESCIGLTEIELPSQLEMIDYFAFTGCSSLNEILISDEVCVCPCAFSSCESLSSVVIGGGVNLGEGAFKDCPNLFEVTMPLEFDMILMDGSIYPAPGMEDYRPVMSDIFGCETVQNVIIISGKTIPSRMFEGMSALTDITFGDTVMSISAGVFSDCTNLENLTFKSENVHIEEGALLETDAVVHCYEDSMVHKYAVKNNLPYVLLEEDTVSREVGDLNNDSVVELTDLTILSLYLIGDRSLDESDLVYADVTKNGKVDIADLAALKQYIMKS